METTNEAFNSVGSLLNVLDAQITETNARIDSLLQTAKSLVPASEFEVLSKQPAESSPTEFDEDRLVSELDKARLELLMDVQKYDYISGKYEEMIGENEELVRNIVEYYEGAEERDKMQKEASRKLLQHYTEDVLGEKKEILRSNCKELEKSYLEAVKGAHETLTSILKAHDTLLSEPYKSELNKLVDALNKSLNSMTRK